MIDIAIIVASVAVALVGSAAGDVCFPEEQHDDDLGGAWLHSATEADIVSVVPRSTQSASMAVMITFDIHGELRRGIFKMKQGREADDSHHTVGGAWVAG